MDAHIEGKKQQMCEAIAQNGFDLFQVQDLVNEKGVWQDDVMLVMDLMRKGMGQQFVNPLKVQHHHQGAPRGMPVNQNQYMSVP